MDDSMAGLYSPFQSTLPGWGATRRPFRSVWRRNFNPRSPDGERQDAVDATTAEQSISIHAPRMGSDMVGSALLPGLVNFNPRSPDGERRSIRASARPTIHFNPRSPDGERLSNVYDLVNRLRFQSTLPGWGATRLPDAIRGTPKRFQSTLPGWGATFVEFSRAGSVGFQSTLPGWGATCRSACSPCLSRHFNPRSPDGERPRAPRCSTRTSRYFNPRSPDGERLAGNRTPYSLVVFQSTLPGWGATQVFADDGSIVGISIHAPRMGSDMAEHGHVRRARHFNPRSPDGERLEFLPCFDSRVLISIHAPRMGSDPARQNQRRGGTDFNPRSPDGERLSLTVVQSVGSIFQSTLPGWGATRAVVRAVPKVAISIHAPRMGSDLAPAIRLRVPAGISIHAPRMGSDYACWLSARFHPVFQSTLPGWGATTPATATATPTGHFNPRSPDGERLFTLPASTFRRVFQSTLPGWGATICPPITTRFTTFQSTLPGWGATNDCKNSFTFVNISIHAPRMGSDDRFNDFMVSYVCYFNPRSPDGERQSDYRFSNTLV